MHVLGKAPTPNTKSGPVKEIKQPKAKTAKQSTEQPADALEDFLARAADFPSDAMMLLFWQNRMANPTFSTEVTPADLQAFAECMKYLDVEPQIRIFRPQGAPARAAVPATGERSAIPARPAGAPKDYVVMQMVDVDGNAIVPVESNERDHERMQLAKNRKHLLATAPQLAAALRADLQAGVFSTSTIEEAAKTLVALVQA